MMAKTKTKKVRVYKVGTGFNLGIGEQDRDKDFGPGVVIKTDTGLEVRYDVGAEVTMAQLPKQDKDVLRWLASRGCLIRAGVQEETNG